MLATAAAIVLAGAAPASAEPAPRAVALLSTEPQVEVTRVIADELRAAGYAVQIRDDARALEPGAMAATQPCASAWACVGLSSTGTGWSARVLTRDGSVFNTSDDVLLAEEGPDAAQTLGLRLADALHAVETAPPPAPPKPPPAPRPEDSPPRLLLGAEATLAGSPGGASPTLGPSIALTYFPRRVVGIDVVLHATALEARRSETEGLALLGMSWAWVGVALRRAWPRVAIGARVGGGPLLAWARGRAATGFHQRRELAGGAVAGAAPFVDVRLARSLYLRTSGWLLFTIPKLDLSVAGRRVATVGLPLLGVSIGLAWGRA